MTAKRSSIFAWAGRRRGGTRSCARAGGRRGAAGRGRPRLPQPGGPPERLVPEPGAVPDLRRRRAGPSGWVAACCRVRTGPKYKNTQATALYDKSRVLYGLNWAKGAIVERGQVVVCEGYTDVIGLHRAGVTEAVATCGTALAEGHVRLLTGFSRRIVLAYDADSAGQGAAEHFYDWERRFEADISVVALPAGADPADLAKNRPGAPAPSRRGGQALPGFPARAAFRDRPTCATPRAGPGRLKRRWQLISEHPDASSGTST